MDGKGWVAIIVAVCGVLTAAIPAVIGVFNTNPPPSPGVVIHGNVENFAPGGTVNSTKITVNNVWNNYARAWSDGVKSIFRSRGATDDLAPLSNRIPASEIPPPRMEPQPEPVAPLPAMESTPEMPPSGQHQSSPSAPALKEQERMRSTSRSKPCLLECRAGDCTFATLGNVPTQLKAGQVQLIPYCQMVEIQSGEFVLRYRSKGRWFIHSHIRANTSVPAVLGIFPPDPCGMISPLCIQERMQAEPRSDVGSLFSDQARQKSEISASLFDGGEGAPCLLGLPCGPVMNKMMEGTWEFNLADKAIAGYFYIMKAREREWSDRDVEGSGSVRSGRVVVEFSRRLSPGYVYKYLLVDKSRRVLSSGNFFLLTPRMQFEVESAFRQKDYPSGRQGMAWVDTLAEFGLDWDAYQGLLALK